MNQSAVKITKPNNESIFWGRVALHRELGLVPAGQVNPPPRKKKIGFLKKVQDIIAYIRGD